MANQHSVVYPEPTDVSPELHSDALVDNGDGTWSVAAKQAQGSGAFVVGKASNEGIKVDQAAPTYPWRTIQGDVNPKTTGPGRPSLSVFRGGVVETWFYSAGDQVKMRFSIPHDYALGTDLVLICEWSHNGTAISGSLGIDYYITYSKGHDQDIFPAEKNPQLSVSTPDIATIPQYSLQSDTTTISTSGGSATQIDTDDLEPDGLLILMFKTTTIPTITGGSVNEPTVLSVNLCYQSTNVGTKSSAPPFYT